MDLPIGLYGLIVGLFAILAIGSGAWLLMRARDVARIADTPEGDVVPGRARRALASKAAVRAVLVVNILSTVAAFSLFALIATGGIDSGDTQTDPQAQRP